MSSRIITPQTYATDMARWYPLKEHPVQTALVNDVVRFKVVPAGRRSGKTERAKRFVAREAMREVGAYFLGAPTRAQVKRVYWQDMKRLTLSSVFTTRPSESELTIYLPNGSTVSLIGLDQPQRMEGTIWTGGVIDEIADVKEGAWAENISPALDTFNPMNPGFRAWCWLIGVPDGLNHYHDLAQYALNSGDPDWKFYTWKSSDILPPDVIAAAKRRMSLSQYRQEYEASFETATGRIYPDYSPRNFTSETIQKHEQIMMMCDFNFTPMSTALGVWREGLGLCLLDEIILVSAVAKQTAQEFVERYKHHENKSLVLYGDPAGRAGEKHGHASDYVDIEYVLRRNGWYVERRVKSAAPAIKDRQNAVRAMIVNAAGEVSLRVNIEKAKYCHKGLATVQLKKGSTFIEEEGEFQHITTAIGYCVDYEWPIISTDAIVQPMYGKHNDR